MHAESLIGLIEEMIDLKIQRYAETSIKCSPELADVLRSKRETDKRRLEQIKIELARIVTMMG
jgi:hypothetical protein